MGIRKDTISSIVFVRIMANLDKWIYDNHKLGYIEVWIKLDNYHWYFNKLALIIISKLNLKVTFLWIYYPDFAPVEQWFSFIKNRLALNKKDESVSLN